MLLCKAIGGPVCSAYRRGEDADLHVQPLVAVDDVVAAAARDDVAAVAAEDDVAAVEGGDAGAEHLLQAGDEGDAFGVERAAEEARRAARATAARGPPPRRRCPPGCR